MREATHDRGASMDRSSVAGRAIGTGFNHEARIACEAFRATVSYLSHTSQHWLYVIPSYPACIAVNRALDSDQFSHALAIGLGHILSFHQDRDVYIYGPDFVPHGDRDGEHVEAELFARAFSEG